MGGLGILPAVVIARPVPDLPTEAQRVRRELLDAFRVSEKMTLITAEQMPAELYEFKYTPEAMTFGEQWQHCCHFAGGMLTGRLNIANPYADWKLPIAMTKAQVLDEIAKLYQFMRQTVETMPDTKLFEETDYTGGKIPNWRLMYAMDNHIIHHRGQCMVYLRLKGITPTGYLGW